MECSNQFAFDLYGRLRADHGNLFFSPASLSTALAMTSAGAAGETAAEMASTLHVQGSRQQLDEAMRALLASWKANDKKQGFRLSVANRLVGTNRGAVLARLSGRDTHRLRGRTGTARLCPPRRNEARQTINKWVEDQTAGKNHRSDPRTPRS